MKMQQEHMPCQEMEKSPLYRIGMFAAMNHVTVKALRFYEEQGLLLPALIHPETGYRYYTLSQMAELHRMTALKQGGFTLEEIARLNAGTDEEALLMKKKAALLALGTKAVRLIVEQMETGYHTPHKNRAHGKKYINAFGQKLKKRPDKLGRVTDAKRRVRTSYE